MINSSLNVLALLIVILIILFAQNYRHCFQESESGRGAFDKAAVYPVLNRTGISAIAWQGHNGIYVMVATVVDKTYRQVAIYLRIAVVTSYC